MKRNCVEVQNVSKGYIRPNGEKVMICRNFNLDIEKGKINVIIGDSGCGKTTLLNMIAGFENYEEGNIRLDSDCKMGILFQDNVLYPWKTVMGNMLFACKHAFNDPKVVVREYMNKVGLHNIENCYPNELSGGMQQRIALLRILLTNPNLLLLDEAFGSLDCQTRNQMQNLFLDLHAEKRFTALVVTHDILEATLLGDNIFVFRGQPLSFDVIKNHQKADGNYAETIERIKNVLNIANTQLF